MMRFASSLTTNADTEQALDELLSSIDRQLDVNRVDLALLFVTAHYEDDIRTVAGRLSEALSGAVLAGCTAEGTIGAGQEVERRPSMSLLAASLPGVVIRPFSLQQEQFESMDDPEAFRQATTAPQADNSIYIAFADPFRFDVMGFVHLLNEACPGRPLFGGIASAGWEPGQNHLFLNDEILREGIVGVSLAGNLVVEHVVSQGCRPIGRHMVITRCERNIIQELSGKPPLAQLKQVLEELSPEDEKLARQALFLGRVIDEYKEDFARGDFLIHNIIGFDQHGGAIAINGPVRRGATVQFHVRDFRSADQDLREALAGHVGLPYRGAMLFGCNGRGTRMWPYPGHDINVLTELVGDIPVGGFFCGGEFGAVGGTNFIHGFTASIGLFREANA